MSQQNWVALLSVGLQCANMHCHLHSKGSASHTSLPEDISVPFLSGSQGGGGGEGRGMGESGDGYREDRAALIPGSQNGEGRVVRPGEVQSLVLPESSGCQSRALVSCHL